jgi:hypothetical protein
MATKEEQLLHASKEIIVKFIEVGKVSPTSFRDQFFNVFDTLKQAVENSYDDPTPKKP